MRLGDRGALLRLRCTREAKGARTPFAYRAIPIRRPGTATHTWTRRSAIRGIARAAACGLAWPPAQSAEDGLVSMAVSKGVLFGTATVSDEFVPESRGAFLREVRLITPSS